jgi:hypothetical protein
MILLKSVSLVPPRSYAFLSLVFLFFSFGPSFLTRACSPTARSATRREGKEKCIPTILQPFGYPGCVVFWGERKENDFLGKSSWIVLFFPLFRNRKGRIKATNKSKRGATYNFQ